jgi:signal peptidase I
MTHTRRLSGALGLALVLAALWLFLAPAALGGHFSVVTTHGTSMKPRFSTGDLAIVRHQERYHAGDVVAYRSDILGRVVMHRIVDVQDGVFTFKGDNNDYLDPDRVLATKCIGKLALRIPRGGLWLHRATSPVALAITVAAILGAFAAGSTARPRRRHTVSRHAAAPRRSSSTWLYRSRNVGGLWAAVSMAVLVSIPVAAFAWTTPPTTTTVRQERVSSSVAFSYSAQVPRSAAYTDSVVNAPDPVFRKVTDRVRVTYHYLGAPAQVRVDVVLRADSGWHATVPLSETRTVASDETGSVDLDLNALDARARAAAMVIAAPADQVSVTVVPRFTSPDATTFSPALKFMMTANRFALAGDASSLHVADNAMRPAKVPAARAFGVGPVLVSVAQARFVSLGLLAVALLGAMWLTVASLRGRNVDEGALIRRKHAHLLIEVEPISTLAGRPTVEVAAFATLTKLTERYGLLILHWSRSGVDTYLVQDQSVTYRYRTGNVHEAHDVHGVGVTIGPIRSGD